MGDEWGMGMNGDVGLLPALPPSHPNLFISRGGYICGDCPCLARHRIADFVLVLHCLMWEWSGCQVIQNYPGSGEPSSLDHKAASSWGPRGRTAAVTALTQGKVGPRPDSSLTLGLPIISDTLLCNSIQFRWRDFYSFLLVQPLPGWASIMGWVFLKTGFFACSWSIWFWLHLETFYRLVSVFYVAFTLVWMVLSHAYTL